MDILTSHHMLLHILAAAGSMDHFEMCVLGPICSGCIGHIALDKLVFAWLLCPGECGIR